jgi:hypothetical protein
MLLLFVGAARLCSQNPEAGVTVLNNAERVLRINANRPLDSAAQILASDYQINISAEDPLFACSQDVVDTHPGLKNPLAAEHAYVPRGSRFEVRFSVNSLRYPLNTRSLLDQVVAAYNDSSSFRYRLEQQGDFFSFVPIRGRDAHCRSVKIDALLDQPISVRSEPMSIYQELAPSSQRLAR